MRHQEGLWSSGSWGLWRSRRIARALDAGHARRRAVLAVLLLDLRRIVPMEALMDRVWGQEPAASALNTLYGYVARLKSVIGGASDPGVTLSRRAGRGLAAGREAGQLDLCRFRHLAASAVGGCDDKRRAGLLRQALGVVAGGGPSGRAQPMAGRHAGHAGGGPGRGPRGPQRHGASARASTARWSAA